MRLNTNRKNDLKYLLFLRKLVILFCAGMLMNATIESAEAFVMVREGRPVCFIVLSEDASPAERYAAKELSSHIKSMTGAVIPSRVMEYGDIPSTGRAVLLGQGDWMQNPRFSGSVEDMKLLGDQGLVIRSYNEDELEVLVIGSNSARGTLYAVYELLRRIGVRWYTHDITRYPETKTINLGDIDIGDIPCFDIRGITVRNSDVSNELKARLRLNVGYGFMEDELGCAPLYNPATVTPGDLVPFSLFEKHPELFPLIEGENTVETDVRCFSNPYCAAVAADSIIACLSRDPAITHISIRCKNAAGCQCSKCISVKKREKSESGLILTWVNSVAEKVQRQYPDVIIELCAAGSIERPPEKLKPAENVIIHLYPQGVDQRYTYVESIDIRTMEFIEHFRGWQKLTQRIVVSHDCGNRNMPSAPFPDFRQIMDNIDMYHYEFVEGCIFRCSDLPGMFIADAPLRMWLLSELMWDRYQDGNSLVREWMRGVYGNAKNPMMDYWKHVQKIALTPNIRISADTAPLEYISEDWLERAELMFQIAYALSLTDSTSQRYVRKERLSLWYLRLIEVLKKPDKIMDRTERRKYIELLDKFLNECAELGYERMNVTETLDEFAERLRGKLRK